MKRPNITAPAISSIIIAVVLVVSRRDFLNPSQFRERPSNDTSKTPAAPTAPASVGVNQPAKRPPIDIAKIIKTSPNPPFNAVSRSCQLAFGPAGPRSGLRRVSITMVNIYNNISSMPGKIPAINSLPIDCSVDIP